MSKVINFELYLTRKNIEDTIRDALAELNRISDQMLDQEDANILDELQASYDCVSIGLDVARKDLIDFTNKVRHL